MTDPSATPVLPAAVVHGCAAGPAVPDVLLIHGAGGDHRHFPPALTDLPGVRVHALDLPGHGAAEGRFADSVEVYADAVAAYVESRGLARVVLAGHSMGGAVVMTLALRAPAWLRAQVLIGTHDFTSFRDTQCQAKSPVKTLEKLDVTRDGDEISVVTEARSFLHHQVRNMVGTLRMVGHGKWGPKEIRIALDAKNRAAAGETAPPDGLYLTGVEYQAK